MRHVQRNRDPFRRDLRKLNEAFQIWFPNTRLYVGHSRNGVNLRRWFLVGAYERCSIDPVNLFSIIMI